MFQIIGNFKDSQSFVARIVTVKANVVGTRPTGKSSTVNLEIANYKKLATLRRRYPDRLRLRAPANAVKMTLRQQAAGAARLRDLDVLVARIAADGCERSERSVSQWDETRVWDPGD